MSVSETLSSAAVPKLPDGPRLNQKVQKSAEESELNSEIIRDLRAVNGSILGLLSHNNT